MENRAAPQPKGNMGQPVPRIDGILKVTGGAKYPADIKIENPAYGYLVTSSIARGTIAKIETSEALKTSGVIDVITYRDLSGKIKKPIMMGAEGGAGYSGSTSRPLDSSRVAYDGQIIGLVLAETFEAAVEAAHLVQVTYAAESPSAVIGSEGLKIQAATSAKKTHEDPKVGDAERAFSQAEYKIDKTYTTPAEHHNAIELFSTSCVWNGAQLTVYEPSQTTYGLKFGLAQQLGVDPDNIRVISEYIGGAFGSKGAVTERTAIVALAAQKINRPIKLVISRAQGFSASSYRAETRQRVALSATKDGKLTSLIHEGLELTSRDDAYFVGGTDATSRMYACPNILTKITIAHADRKTPGFMRAPAEVPYMYALESAMDEMAEKIGMDPVEFRRVNDTMIEPIKGLEYTSRSLMKCFDEAAASFGWDKRNKEPGKMRRGEWLVGHGCATSCYPTLMAPASVRVTLKSDGTALVETAAQDVGTGTYTILAQLAAEQLGVTIDKVSVLLGDSKLPPSPVSGGSNVTASVCTALMAACDNLKSKLGNDSGANLGASLQKANLKEMDGFAETVAPGAPKIGIDMLHKGVSAIDGGTKLKDRIQFSFGAQFIEVEVHSLTNEIRVPRMVGAFAAGRIMNPRTSRSQLLGGMIGGIGSALLEITEVEKSSARYINKNLADYEIPVNADIQQLEIIMIPETDNKVNPLGIKGLGELGIVGTAAAVSNAVYNATGKRVRSLPIRIDDLIM